MKLINDMLRSSSRTWSLTNTKYDAKFQEKGPLTRKRMRRHYPRMK